MFLILSQFFSSNFDILLSFIWENINGNILVKCWLFLLELVILRTCTRFSIKMLDVLACLHLKCLSFVLQIDDSVSHLSCKSIKLLILFYIFMFTCVCVHVYALDSCHTVGGWQVQVWPRSLRLKLLQVLFPLNCLWGWQCKNHPMLLVPRWQKPIEPVLG